VLRCLRFVTYDVFARCQNKVLFCYALCYKFLHLQNCMCCLCNYCNKILIPLFYLNLMSLSLLKFHVIYLRYGNLGAYILLNHANLQTSFNFPLQKYCIWVICTNQIVPNCSSLIMWQGASHQASERPSVHSLN